MRNRKNKICEICGCSDRAAIHLHHIIPRTDPNSTDTLDNLAIICANCHAKVHKLQLVIEGVYMTSDGPKLFWHKAGEPYIVRKGVILKEDGTALVLEE
jgi:hypothetical protein